MSVHVGGRGPGHLARSGGAFYPSATTAFDFQLQKYRNGAGTSFVRDLSAVSGWSFTRASAKTALNSAGQVISFASGVPAITDLGWLDEPAATNLVLNSVLASVSAGAPTSWTANAGGGSAATSLYGSDSAAMTFVASASRPFIQQVISVSASSSYAFSALVEANPGGLTAQELVAAVSVPAGATGNYPGGALSVPSAGTWVTQIITVAGTAGTATFRVGVGVNSSQTGSATLSRPQAEVGLAKSSYIPTTTATVTRAADAATLTYTGSPSTATVSYGTSSTASPSPVSPLNLGASSGGAWVGNYVLRVIIQ